MNQSRSKGREYGLRSPICFLSIMLKRRHWYVRSLSAKKWSWTIYIRIFIHMYIYIGIYKDNHNLYVKNSKFFFMWVVIKCGLPKKGYMGKVVFIAPFTTKNWHHIFYLSFIRLILYGASSTLPTYTLSLLSKVYE